MPRAAAASRRLRANRSLPSCSAIVTVIRRAAGRQSAARSAPVSRTPALPLRFFTSGMGLLELHPAANGTFSCDRASDQVRDREAPTTSFPWKTSGRSRALRTQIVRKVPTVSLPSDPVSHSTRPQDAPTKRPGSGAHRRQTRVIRLRTRTALSSDDRRDEERARRASAAGSPGDPGRRACPPTTRCRHRPASGVATAGSATAARAACQLPNRTVTTLAGGHSQLERRASASPPRRRACVRDQSYEVGSRP